MKKVYITVVGMNHYHGTGFIVEKHIGALKVKLSKDTDNEYDQEAIKVTLPGLGKIGYVANSTRTVCEDCYSGGRLYDKFNDSIEALVEYKLDCSAIVCSVEIPGENNPENNDEGSDMDWDEDDFFENDEEEPRLAVSINILDDER